MMARLLGSVAPGFVYGADGAAHNEVEKKKGGKGKRDRLIIRTVSDNERFRRRRKKRRRKRIEEERRGN